ncbi:cytochrome ubiquinol oxidase subunit I [Paenibacillus beijingensis]|uniref:Cytochrome D ubiquinol oxidase subunit I n=1 Tax=Paenibacillus beijingensis TaxID=1126833 RepID=A0A0D5NQP3_9BACL|nr:cytochrome ubiquinol oxidase subunit I [Paenibacillus beijingensis]AJY77312.1 cytochrome D ubiquinol oxidase subunit I [Paenibacillus beijingensis]
MDNVTLARSLFGSSMAFHIIFATLGVGLPLMIIAAEVLFHVKKDPDYAAMAKRWTRALAILLGVAIPSGTIVGVMLALLWPGFMEIVGQVISLPFQIEIWAFFLEALFMSIYVYAADRLTPWMRIVSVVFVSIGASASAVLITDAHAWMNTPRGFSIANGQVTDVDPWAAVWNPSFVTTSIHVVASAYMTGAFAVASVAAWKLLRKGRAEREYIYHRKGLFLALLIGGVMSLATAVNGHETAQMLHENEPEKLAAAEGLFQTQSHAPLAIGGFVDEEKQEVVGAIEIPWALSFLAGNRFDTVVRGLNDFPRENWPPLFVHTLFNLMVLIGTVLIVLSFGALLYRRLRKRDYPRWLLRVLTLTGPMSLIGIETGWIFSCSARQPWTIYHIQRTSEAATTAGNLGALFVLFIGLYTFLLFATSAVMLFYFKRHPVARELAGTKG